jgi:hypothetical protein
LSGELWDLETVNQVMVATLGRLEHATRRVVALEREYAAVKREYDRVFRRAVRLSAGTAADTRESDGFAAVEEARLGDGDYASPVDLASRRYLLEGELKAMKAAGHDERRRLSSLDNMSANLRQQMRTELGPMA